MSSATEEERRNSQLKNIPPNLQSAYYYYILGSGIFLLGHLLLGWIWLLAWLTRRGVILAAKLFLPGFGRALTPSDVILVEEYHAESQHAMSIAVIMTLEGDVGAKEVATAFTQEVLHAKTRKNADAEEELLFPELTQYQSTFLGFPFWRKDPSFCVENHVHQVFYDDPNTPQVFKNYDSLSGEFCGRAYPPKRGPWEIWLVRNFPDDDGSSRTVLIFRAHHSLMGGLSILNILIRLYGDNPARRMPVAKVLHKQEGRHLSISRLCSMPLDILRGICKLLQEISQNGPILQSIFAERRKRGFISSQKVHFKQAPPLPLGEVKKLAASLGVRVPALLTTLVAESMSQVVVDEGGGRGGGGGNVMNALFSVPLPDHPEAIVNHAFTSTIKLPISKNVPIATKLEACNQTFLDLRHNPVNGLIQYLTYVLGTLPPKLANWATSPRETLHTPLTITNFAISSERFVFRGRECLDIRGGLGTPPQFTGSVVTMLGYKDHVQMLFAVNDSLFCEQDVERICCGIGRAFEELQCQSATSLRQNE